MQFARMAEVKGDLNRSRYTNLRRNLSKPTHISTQQMVLLALFLAEDNHCRAAAFGRVVTKPANSVYQSHSQTSRSDTWCRD